MNEREPRSWLNETNRNGSTQTSTVHCAFREKPTKQFNPRMSLHSNLLLYQERGWTRSPGCSLAPLAPKAVSGLGERLSRQTSNRNFLCPPSTPTTLPRPLLRLLLLLRLLDYGCCCCRYDQSVHVSIWLSPRFFFVFFPIPLITELLDYGF